MYKLTAIFLVAFVVGESVAMSHRLRRQSGATPVAAQAQVQPVSPSSPTPGNGQGGLSQAETDLCIQNCPVTSEFNPVCGSNRVTYSNPGRLTCAQACGVSVSLFRAAPCPKT